MDKRYINAFIAPPKYIIGGVEMDLFCPRHHITLQAAGSPFVERNPKGLSGKDLFVAMRICSTKSWVDSIKPLSFIERIKYLLIDSIPDRQAQAFVDFGKYISSSMSIPKVWVKNEDSETKSNKSSNIPETISMVVVLMTKFGFSEEDAWNMPFSKAIWYSTIYASQEGSDISIITTEEEDLESKELEELNKFEQKMRDLISSNNTKRKK